MAFTPNQSVLVIDDNFAILRIVKTLLDGQGVKDVDGAGSGPEAIRMLSKKSYGLIISDFFMMPMNGIDLKLVIDRSSTWAQIPFLLMTTREETYDRSKFEKARIKHVLLKPFTAQKLMEAIDEVSR